MNPYKSLPQRSFWRPAVSERDIWTIGELWTPMFPIDAATKIVTVGSCFAQHIGRALKEASFNWLDAEPAPFHLPESLHHKYGYGTFSFRTGNIYTAAMLRQWLSWALGKATPPAEVWRDVPPEGGERFLDPFRPNIEPGGFVSIEELEALRGQTLACIAKAAAEADLWIFTLGLTEAWGNRATGHVYAVCPGTVGGTFDEKAHGFHNYLYPQILDDLRASIAMVQEIRADAKFLLTVSPVPLTATASGNHVLVATEYSKSVLRAVAEDVKRGMPNVDYFPSYEIITAPPFRGIFFDPNMRTVSPAGVDFVMKKFFSAIGATLTMPVPATERRLEMPVEPECEDALLDMFATR